MNNKGDMRATAKPLKVVELGLQTRVYQELMKPNPSVDALTRQLNSEGFNITAQSVRKFIAKTKDAQRHLIAKDFNVASDLKQLTIDYTKTIKDILDEVKEVKDTARTERDFATYNQLVGRLMQGIELMAKLSGDIRPKGSVDINIIYNEINNDIEKTMSKLKTEIYKAKIIDIDAEIVEEDNLQTKIINAQRETD